MDQETRKGLFFCLNTVRMVDMMNFEGYLLDSGHCFCDSVPVRMYFLQDKAFTYDPLTREEKEDRWILYECAANPEYTEDEIHRNSEYLIEEELHPLLFDVPLIDKEGVLENL